MSQQKEETALPPLSTKSSQIEQVEQVEEPPAAETTKQVEEVC